MCCVRFVFLIVKCCIVVIIQFVVAIVDVFVFVSGVCGFCRLVVYVARVCGFAGWLFFGLFYCVSLCKFKFIVGNSVYLIHV